MNVQEVETSDSELKSQGFGLYDVTDEEHVEKVVTILGVIFPDTVEVRIQKITAGEIRVWKKL